MHNSKLEQEHGYGELGANVEGGGDGTYVDGYRPPEEGLDEKKKLD